MNHSRTIIFGLALTGLGILGTLEARPAAAQDLTYTLQNVTFDDGAVAHGSFEFNPTTQALGPYDITTTDSAAGSVPAVTGIHYVSATGTPQQVVGNQTFRFYDNFSTSLLTQEVKSFPPSNSSTSPGLHDLVPGFASPFTVAGSGEYNSVQGFFVVPRGITSGSVLVTPAVPEASTTVSFGLLLALGWGGVVIAARRRGARSVTR